MRYAGFLPLTAKVRPNSGWNHNPRPRPRLDLLKVISPSNVGVACRINRNCRYH